jgi:hypothetical protein
MKTAGGGIPVRRSLVEDVGWVETPERLNIEHRTSNIEHQMWNRKR